MRMLRHLLFGIGAAMALAFVQSVSAVSATGGIVTDIDGYRIHTFTNSAAASDFVVTVAGNVEVLIVAGGGGGGSVIAGGGGAGGVLHANSYFLSAGTNAVVVGAGGAGAAQGSWIQGTSGSNSSFGPLIAAPVTNGTC